MDTLKKMEAYRLLQRGEITIRQLKGISDEEMTAGVRASRRLLAAGENQAAAEVLAGLALYDPYRADVWSSMEELCRRERLPQMANLCAGLARAVS